MAIDPASNGLCIVIVGDVVIGCEAGKPVEGSVASFSGCDGARGEVALVCILDEWTEDKFWRYPLFDPNCPCHEHKFQLG